MNLEPLSDNDKAWLTEVQAIAMVDYAFLSPDQKRDLDRRWAEVPEDTKDDLRMQIELDLL